MIDAAAATDPPLAPDRTEAAFRAWLRRLVSGAAELEAFDAGEIDAVMDRDSGCALLLPEAQNALHDSSRIALSAFDALPGEVCVLDASGVVVMANKAWRVSGAAHARAGLDVRAGENIFAACRDAPEGERIHADAVAAGLRNVIAGLRQPLSVRYVCPSPRGDSEFTLTLAATSAPGPMNLLLSREWHSEGQQAGKISGAISAKPRHVARIAHAAAENRLLAALPASDYARLEKDLEPVTIAYGDVLFEPGERMREVYFPGTCLVSLLTLVEGHRALEVGLVGREGMVGARLALGATKSSVRAMVLGAGTAMRMSAECFLRESRRSQTLQRVLLRFTDRLMIQISQTAACNSFHILEARLARWLLMTAEHMGSAAFHLTHGLIADMLGVRREGVTVAAIALQRRGIIRYRRGNITILDRQELEAACCSCYRHLQLME
ncbi:MAG: Crp/Fnr family transcriptional regulator [Pseudomonadota bacterium]